MMMQSETQIESKVFSSETIHKRMDLVCSASLFAFANQFESVFLKLTQFPFNWIVATRLFLIDAVHFSIFFFFSFHFRQFANQNCTPSESDAAKKREIIVCTSFRIKVFPRAWFPCGTFSCGVNKVEQRKIVKRFKYRQRLCQAMWKTLCWL